MISMRDAVLIGAIVGANKRRRDPSSEDFKKLVEVLEGDMRRYVYDKTPERRLECLDAFRERLGLCKWSEKQ